MKKKYLAPVAIALIATISITTASCGKPADEEVNATEAEVTTTEESTEEITEAETMAAAGSTVEMTKAETEVEPTKTETKAAPKAEEPKAPAPIKAAPTTEHVQDKGPAPTQAAPKAPAPTEAPAPVHEHQWKEHKATRQEWVSNIVSVPDYETREQKMSFIICNCGAEFRADDSSFAAHASAHILAGEPSNYWDEV